MSGPKQVPVYYRSSCYGCKSATLMTSSVQARPMTSSGPAVRLSDSGNLTTQRERQGNGRKLALLRKSYTKIFFSRERGFVLKHSSIPKCCYLSAVCNTISRTRQDSPMQFYCSVHPTSLLSHQHFSSLYKSTVALFFHEAQTLFQLFFQG